MKSDIIIGVDNGLKGAICILNNIQNSCCVYSMPVKTNAKGKNEYDLSKIIDILNSHKDQRVLMAQETASPRFHEGSVSSFTNGRNFGQMQGIAYAFNFNLILVTPQSWKKHFPDLESKVIVELREKSKELKLKGKMIKDNKAKKENKKEIEKLKKQIKVESKDQARFLATKLFPSLSEQFKLKKDDGNAESALIAIFAKETLNK